MCLDYYCLTWPWLGTLQLHNSGLGVQQDNDLSLISHFPCYLECLNNSKKLCIKDLMSLAQWELPGLPGSSSTKSLLSSPSLSPIPSIPLLASSPWAVSTMALRSRPVGSDNKQNQSDASSNLTETFSDNRSDIDSTSNPELDSEDSDDENKSSDNTSDNEDSCLLSIIWPKQRA